MTPELLEWANNRWQDRLDREAANSFRGVGSKKALGSFGFPRSAVQHLKSGGSSPEALFQRLQTVGVSPPDVQTGPWGVHWSDSVVGPGQRGAFLYLWHIPMLSAVTGFPEADLRSWVEAHIQDKAAPMSEAYETIARAYGDLMNPGCRWVMPGVPRHRLFRALEMVGAMEDDTKLWFRHEHMEASP